MEPQPREVFEVSIPSDRTLPLFNVVATLRDCGRKLLLFGLITLQCIGDVMPRDMTRYIFLLLGRRITLEGTRSRLVFDCIHCRLTESDVGDREYHLECTMSMPYLWHTERTTIPTIPALLDEWLKKFERVLNALVGSELIAIRPTSKDPIIYFRQSGVVHYNYSISMLVLSHIDIPKWMASLRARACISANEKLTRVVYIE
jgi:hypothetical protein